MTWTACLLGGLFLINACGTSESVQDDGASTRTLQLTALDSTSGEPLDSAQAVNRTLGDSLRTDSAGTFVIEDVEPALYVFDVSGYGYHPQRHVAALVEPDDTTQTVRTNLLPQRLSINCEGNRPYNWSNLTQQYRDDSTQVRIQLIDVFAEDGEVRVQPVVVNDLPTSTLFLPNNFEALGHYDVTLYDGNNNRIPYRYKDPPPDDEGHRIYSKPDILPVVPGSAERLDPTRLVVGDSIEDGRTLYARMRYTFSADDTLQATSATTFPDLNLDSLQTPVFDTLRTDGRIRVPDSLVIQRDTTVMEVVGIDTTITRNGYTLFSTLRTSNAASSPEDARDLLYVPDSVKARARRDSLEAAAEADTTVPPIDTAAAPPPETQPRLQVVNRTDRLRLDSLITNDVIAQSLPGGLPRRGMTADSLLTLSDPLRDSFLRIPILDETEVRRGLDTDPDTTRRDSVILSAPASDSLFRMLDPPPSTGPDSAASMAERNPFIIPDPGPQVAPGIDSVTVDSLRRTVSPNADSIVTDSVVANDLSNPPQYTYWFVPDSLSAPGTRVMAVSPSFFQLRARTYVDTTTSVNLEGLVPDRVGPRPQIARVEYPQQVIRSPAGTYRSKYLEVWKALQADRLRQQYCQIFPFPLRSQWRSTSMRY